MLSIRRSWILWGVVEVVAAHSPDPDWVCAAWWLPRVYAGRRRQRQRQVHAESTKLLTKASQFRLSPHNWQTQVGIGWLKGPWCGMFHGKFHVPFSKFWSELCRRFRWFSCALFQPQKAAKSSLSPARHTAFRTHDLRRKHICGRVLILQYVRSDFPCLSRKEFSHSRAPAFAATFRKVVLLASRRGSRLLFF